MVRRHYYYLSVFVCRCIIMYWVKLKEIAAIYLCINLTFRKIGFRSIPLTNPKIRDHSHGTYPGITFIVLLLTLELRNARNTVVINLLLKADDIGRSKLHVIIIQ